MTISEALSEKGIEAIQKSTEIGKDMLKEKFRSATVVKLLKSGFWADFESKDGTVVKVSVKTKGKETIISKRS